MLELDTAVDLALEAGKKLMEYHGQDSEPGRTSKPDGSPVGLPDYESNAIIVQGLKDTFPRHSILSEESEDDKSRLSNDHLWIVDPRDGTADREGNFSVMIAYLFQKRPMAAVVYVPVQKKLYTAEIFNGAYLTEDKARRQLQIIPRSLEKSTLILSRKDMTPERAKEICQKLGMNGCKQVGSFGVKVGHIIEGNADLYINNITRAGEWDSCAPGLILSEAGGQVTGYDGKPLSYNKDQPNLPRGAICSTGAFHRKAVELANAHMPLSN